MFLSVGILEDLKVPRVVSQLDPDYEDYSFKRKDLERWVLNWLNLAQPKKPLKTNAQSGALVSEVFHRLEVDTSMTEILIVPKPGRNRRYSAAEMEVFLEGCRAVDGEWKHNKDWWNKWMYSRDWWDPNRNTG